MLYCIWSGANAMTLFTVVIYKLLYNMLDCLFLAGLPSIVYIEWSTRKLLHSGRLQPDPQTLECAGRACQEQKLQTFTNYTCKKSYDIEPWLERLVLGKRSSVFDLLTTRLKKSFMALAPDFRWRCVEPPLSRLRLSPEQDFIKLFFWWICDLKE